MQLSIRHITRYAYEPEATHAALRLKLFPPRTSAQRSPGWKVTVNGQAVAHLFVDGQGDPIGLWHAHQAVDGVEVIAEGVVETEDTAGVLGGLEQTVRPPVYLRRTALTKPDAAISGLADQIQEQDPLGRLHALSALIQDVIDYRPGATDASTTAAEATAMGAGVCQDQAHVFIAAARLMGVPARYVAGYLFDPDSEAPADETHAWAEAHVEGLGWTGFDITNQLCPTDGYVRLACGLDASDAAPVRGVFFGDAEEEMETEIAVAQASTQSQQ